MNQPALQLRTLRPEDEASFINAETEFRVKDPDFSFSFAWDGTQTFGEYLEKLERWKMGSDLPPKFVANTFLVGLLNDEIVGRVSIRHELNTFLDRFGGHIGYCVLPSRRGCGYATEMLRLALPVAKSLGLHQVLITCDQGNAASRRVIEKNGGVYDGTVEGPEVKFPKRRYWVMTHHA